jgi:glucose repression regulatory protein TUP1
MAWHGALLTAGVAQGHKDFVLSVAFSPNGHWLVSGSKDRTVHFWDPQVCARSAWAHPAAHSHSTQLRIGALLRTSAPEGRLDLVLALQYPTTHLMLQGHKNSVISVSHSPIANIVATGSGDNKVSGYALATPDHASCMHACFLHNACQTLLRAWKSALSEYNCWYIR